MQRDLFVIFDVIDILSENRSEDRIKEALELIGGSLKLDNIFILRRDNLGYYETVYSWTSRVFVIDFSDFVSFANDKECDDSCKIIENEINSVLIYNMKVRSMIPFIIGFVMNTKKYSWSDYEKGVLRSFSKLLKEYLSEVDIKYKDSLTGMPSLTDFSNEIDRRMGSLKGKYAIVYSDICGFKNINNMYGYELGNKVLKYIADIIKKSARPDEFCCRVTADKFISVMRCENDESVLKVLNRTTKAIKRKFPEFDRANCAWKSGIYVISGSEANSMQAIDNAIFALNEAKGSDSIDNLFYGRELEEKLTKDRYIVSNLKRALENNEFVVYFQPLLDLETGEVIGSEALVRWIKDGKVIPPSEFIPLLESNNLMNQLDFYVCEKVCQHLTYWLKNNYPVTPVSINLSRLHLKDEGFVEKFVSLIDRYNISHDLIELEITENIFMYNMQNAIRFIQQLKQNGFACAIDDFGSGFSSLNLLRYLPVDVLKLDREFFNEDVNIHINRQIVFHTINLAKSLNMRVLAEGVETEEQSEYLKKCGCDMVQGYYYAKPMPFSEYSSMIKAF